MIKLIIELDGPVLDVEPVYWAAYSCIAAELGLARKDRAEFWRSVRRGGGVGDLLTGAKPRHIQRFREGFPQALESDECLRQAGEHEGVAAELRSLYAIQHVLSLVTLGQNSAARQAVLDGYDLSTHFTEMTRLTGDGYQRLARLRELAVDCRRVLVAASSESLIKLADEAGLFAVGIHGGPCTGRRLTQAGARVTYRGMADLAEEITAGGRTLIDLGLAAPPHTSDMDPRR
ncbi:MAG: HAD family hydrolase [bacterium]|nr:HAD family hydrolase [bacterium]